MNRIIRSILLMGALAVLPAAAQQTPAPMADINGVVDNTPDSINAARMARPVAGSTRRGDNPVLFLVGNSTMRTGTKGNGSNGQWGWGYYMPELFDQSKITVENHALGGMSSRTFYNKLWRDVVKGVRPGDYVIIELGHNDNGPYDSGRARASIPGIGRDSFVVTIQETGVRDTVYSYGEYMRRYIADVRAMGGNPILFSLTPRLAWDEADTTRVARVDKTFGLWARQIAEEQNVPFIDLNDITASKYERFGRRKMASMFYLDRIHTSAMGARENALSAARGLREAGHPLAEWLLPEPALMERSDKPALFIIGDSTVKNTDSDPDGMWGWGSVIAERLDTARIDVFNKAMAGRSARTFFDEGRWDEVYRNLRPGDFVIMQFGHNDGGDINVGKARGELHGSSDESKVYLMEATSRYQVIYSYGWYLRRFIGDALEKGATPIVLSHTPRNKWQGDTIESCAKSFGLWAKEAAEAEGVCFVDLNTLSGNLYMEMGREAVAPYFCRDHSHSSLSGARHNASVIVDNLPASCPLSGFVVSGK